MAETASATLIVKAASSTHAQLLSQMIFAVVHSAGLLGAVAAAEPIAVASGRSSSTWGASGWPSW